MTYITKVCPKCGYKHKAAIYGYVNDPIGITAARCPACNCLVDEAKSREWIQMSPYKKFRAIHPRGTAMAFFPSLLLMVPMISICKFLLPAGFMDGPGVFLPMALAWLLAYYLLTLLKVNSETFRKRYCNSILRSRNPDYLELLKEDGKIYDESFPKWIPVSKKTQQKFEDYLRENADYTNTFQIPTFVDTIENDV